jgi:hypothetical protein
MTVPFPREPSDSCEAESLIASAAADEGEALEALETASARNAWQPRRLYTQATPSGIRRGGVSVINGTPTSGAA